ncbi:MAG: hypothetical protein HYY50_03850 [Candidatus Kerfeldbacteria bacterium]|nr:hypothetical protein [Candidatus Kerfeldbacteria bacterium]
MPLVVVNRNPERVSDENIRNLVLALTAVAAEQLSSDEMALGPGDIEIWVQDFGPLDVHTKDLEIIIWAHDFPSRRANLDERTARIAARVKELAGADISGFVWILLQPTGFKPF